jgi:uncharacterized protein YbjT (DUF2867 family)
VGGTGTVGAEAARELERRGHAVRVLSRHAPEHPVDLRDGSGLAAALDGVSDHPGGRSLVASLHAPSGAVWYVIMRA